MTRSLHSVPARGTVTPKPESPFLPGRIGRRAAWTVGALCALAGPASAAIGAPVPPAPITQDEARALAVSVGRLDSLDPSQGGLVPVPGLRQEAPAADPIGPPAPIDNWRAFDAAFQACLQPLEGPQGAELTVKFALDVKGRLRGKPIASHSRLPGSPDEQRAFVADALTSLDRCLPLPLTAKFGPIVAARPLILRFLGPRPRQRGA